MVIIINGKGCSGKDALIESLQGKIEIDNEIHDIYNFSTISKIKEIARSGGWNDDKSEKGRKLLSDLKRAFSEYNDLPLKTVMQDIIWYGTDRDIEPIFFVHIREPEEIDKAVRAFKNVGERVATLLVQRTSFKNVTYGNDSDDNVEMYFYDTEFLNNVEAPCGIPLSVTDEFAKTVREIYCDTE